MSTVTAVAPAPSERVLEHTRRRLALETDCWDVHAAIQAGEQDFILVDVRSPDAFEQGHLPNAINIPHAKMVAGVMARYPSDQLFVVYCAGPHCNGSTKAALRLAQLGLPVKEMIGGVTGWLDEGFSLQRPG